MEERDACVRHVGGTNGVGVDCSGVLPSKGEAFR